ncbi:diacylglycerol/lipid kinase family protein [Bacteroidota bacterium]
MNNQKIDVIATTISGSISDWGKVKHIVPLFKKYGFNNVSLYAVDSHEEVRKKTTECINSGSRIIISAGGSGTFNSALEGCCDSEVGLSELSLGFLRKGSADLIGKVLGMPDNIDEAIKVFTDSIIANTRIKCDVIFAESEKGDSPPRHFVGYGGAEIFGEIPTYTENRFIKYYKGILSQLFGDMGPFFVGACLASTSKTLRSITSGTRKWNIYQDDKLQAKNIYQALIIVNGDLGKNLPLANGVPLGSGDFYLFGLRNLGLLKLPGQFKHAWKATIQNNPDMWGFETYRISKSLKLEPTMGGIFNVNIDGSTMQCTDSVSFQITDQIKLISKK